jgi:GNAT superfamily N-acetyltransferase
MTTEPMTDSPDTTDRTDAPAGLELRPFRGEPDLAAMVRVLTAANEEDRIEERVPVEGLRNWVEHPSPHFDPAGDIVLAVVDGEAVGYGWTSWVDTTDGLREYGTRGYVHPAWRRRRVGTAILRHNEARLRRLAAGHDTRRPRTYAAYAPERRPGAVALLLGAGYLPVRYFFDMVRPTLDDIVVPELPAGLEIRPIAGREQVRVLFDADVEAFADHWGGFDASDASFESWLTDPDFDPSLFVVAFDGDEIAGAVTNTINRHENEQLGRARGLLDSVFTRRPWRGRGLAAALVARSLLLLRERGMTSAWLGVDADNPTGALGVYERAGFVVDLRSTEYRKPLQEMDR